MSRVPGNVADEHRLARSHDPLDNAIDNRAGSR